MLDVSKAGERPAPRGLRAAAAAPAMAPAPAPRQVVYSARSGGGLSALSGWQEMWSEMVESRELTCRLFLRDFSARYRQSVLGYVWAVVPALLTAATFTYLNRARVLPVGDTALPYPLFVLFGTAVWQLFAGGLAGAAPSLVSARAQITKNKFPRETLVLAAFGQSLFDFGVRALLVAAAFAFYGVAPSWGMLLLPLLLVPLCLLTLGLGFLLGLVNGVVRDVGQMLTAVLGFWMLLTPVVYPAPPGGGAAANPLLAALNPVAPFLVAAQDLAGRGYVTQPVALAVASGAAVAVFFFGWRVFHLAETRIAERV